MKKILSLLAFGLAFATTALAQPAFIFSDASPDNGEQFCLDVTIDDFTDIISMEFTVQWDPAIIQFDQVAGLNLQNLDLGDFDLTNTDDGTLVINWSNDQCGPMGQGVTIDDDTAIFQLCFTALGAYGDVTQVFIPDTPVPEVTRENTGCTNIGLTDSPGFISTSVRPFKLSTSTESGNEGDLVCVDLFASGFDDLTSMQFSVNYDPAVLQFENIVNPGVLPGLGSGAVGTPNNGLDPGEITVAWSYVNPNDPDGITLSDSTVFLQACFTIIGDCESATDIDFTDTPTDIEVTNTVVSGFLINVFTFPGEVTANDCDPVGVQVVADCGPEVELGDSFCVTVSGGANFLNVTELQYLMEWNPAILEYNSVTPILSGMNLGDFNDANAENGVLQIEWDSDPLPPASAAGQPLYEVCFTVVGLGGNSPFNFVTQGAVGRIQGNNTNLGINPANCQVQIPQPEGVTFNLSDVEAELGQNVCVDVAVENFVNVDSMSFTLAWDPSLLAYDGIQNLDFPGASLLANFNQQPAVNSGFITFEWDDATALNLDDGHVIFQICFDLVGDPGSCDQVEVLDIPVNAESTSEGVTLPIAQTGGEACILFPEGFYIDITDTAGPWLDTACIQFRVADFDNIISAQFSVGWEPSGLGCPEIIDPGAINGINFGTGSCDIGLITVDWFNIGATPLADSTIIFEMCFPLTGAPDVCYDVQINETPAPVVETQNGDGSLLSDVGQICIENRLIVVDTIITPASCPDSRDGSIQLIVIGGDDPIGFSWGSTPMQFDTVARNLPPGPIAVTIYDFSSPALILQDTFEIPVLPGAPTAGVPATVAFDCGASVAAITGSGTTGPDYSFSWRGLTGGTPDPDDTQTTTVNQPGLYEFQVINDVSGCIARDTVQVTAANFPTAEAGDDLSLTCDVTSVMLDASASSQGDTVIYQWTGLQGQDITDPNSQTPTVSDTGTYQLEVIYPITGCTAIDTVRVLNGAVTPNAFAGEDAVIGCIGSVTLDGTGSSGVGGLIYEWLNEGGMSISVGPTLTTNQTGAFILEVEDMANGCTDQDTIMIIQNADVPIIDIADPMAEITCVNDTVTLLATVTNAAAFDVEWTELNGGQIVTSTLNSLTPKVIAAGAFELTVTNTDNGCEATASVTVTENTTPPVAEAGDDVAITCDSSSVVLNGSASSTGDAFIYSWTFGANQISTDTTATADQPGTYFLAVLDQSNGCSAIDSVIVTTDTDIPVVSIGTPDTLTCAQGSVSFTATVTPGGQYQYAWIRTDDTTGIISDTLNASLIVSQPGNYQVTATDPQTGCSGVASVTVMGDFSAPTVNAGPNGVLDCDDQSAVLNASITGSADFIFSWTVQGTDGAFQPGTTNSLNPEVISPGNFILSATDTLTGCVARDTVSVIGSGLPLVDGGPALAIDCDTDVVTLDGSGSESGPNIELTWFNPDSTVLSNNAVVNGITDPGFYRLVVTNTATGCSDFDIVEVALDTLSPQLDIAEPDTLTCAQSIVTLSVEPQDEDELYAYSWVVQNEGEILAGTDTTANPQVTAPDNYLLTVTDQVSGCTQTFEVAVASSIVIPEITVAPADTLVFNCDEDFVLFDASASSGANNLLYSWQDLDSSFVQTGPLFEAQEPGSYVLTVRDQVLGCVAQDTVTVQAPADFPVVDAGPDQTITCEQDTITISAAVGGIDDFDFEWTILSGGQFVDGTGQTLEPQVTLGGVYRITVTNPDNNCQARDTVVITENITEPVANAGSNFTLDCVDTEHVLVGEGFILDEFGEPIIDNLTFTWYAGPPEAGMAVANTLDHTVTEPAVYYLEVRDTTNGCVAVDSAVVNALVVDIMLSEPANPPVIGCNDNGQAWVSVVVDPAGQGYDYEWEVISDGNIVDDTGTDSILVDAAGVYGVTVTDPLSSCTAELQITVEEDATQLEAVTGVDTAFITCEMTVVTLSASGSSTGDDIVYEWTAVENGADPAPTGDPQNVEVSVAGVYELVVRDTVSGCSSSATVTVVQDTETPTADFTVSGVITCLQTTATIDATGSTGGNLSFAFTGQSVPDPTPTGTPGVVEVTQGGTYELVVTNEDNGCTSEPVEIVVAEEIDEPTADAGPDRSLACPGDETTLDGSGSSEGAGFTYEWTATGGGVIVSGASTLSPVVNAAGTYQLLVTNEENGCTATAEVTVNTEVELAPADAGDDLSLCGDTTMLMANLPAGVTGMWQSLSGATVETPDMGSTFVSGMAPGQNLFVWTLSSDSCPEYSSDTLSVIVEELPVVNDDEVLLGSGVFSADIDPLDNDLLGNIQNFTFSIVSGPSLGQIDEISDDNVLSYSVREGFFGTDVIVYEVCNTACPDLCATGEIQIIVEQGPDDEFFAPNGITPNGDGLNDTFVFDILNSAPAEEFPDNEMTIFNRWGDIVFQARPYQNDWDGTGEGGVELPQGTYYYILRLNIAEGVILKGDVTIVR